MNIEQFDLTVNPDKALLWEYDQAQNLIALINAKKAWYEQNHQNFWEEWFNNVFNLTTLNEFGCSVWAIILGVTFQIQQESRLTTDAIGLDYTDAPNFDRSNFGSYSAYFVGMTLEQKQLILRMRYRQLTSRGTLPEINSMLADIFGQHKAYAVDNLNMTISVGLLNPDPDLYWVLVNYNLLPIPAGVGVTYSIYQRPSLGFDYTDALNFDRGNFGA